MYATSRVQPLLLGNGVGRRGASGRVRLASAYLDLTVDAQSFWTRRQAHSAVAYLSAAIAAHISAVLLHTVALRDRLIERMTFRLSRRGRPIEDSRQSGPNDGQARLG